MHTPHRRFSIKITYERRHHHDGRLVNVSAIGVGSVRSLVCVFFLQVSMSGFNAAASRGYPRCTLHAASRGHGHGRGREKAIWGVGALAKARGQRGPTEGRAWAWERMGDGGALLIVRTAVRG